MTALVIAEHDNATLKGATLNTVAAAAHCGGEVHVLIAGHNARAAAAAAAQIAGVAKVIAADTFERPIYAGNAIATVQGLDATHVITVRTTGFDPAAATGGS
ncbi:MAG: electron transfer flavoprotein subunit alpha/FixB family protein, partial [Hydrogenophaga sp.]|nr:electron transfer flavoprotein subunit alpha/FixB family protein [Hydrogenophaga sp.]